MCYIIYIGSMNQTVKKGIDGHFSNFLCLLKNGQKSDLFATHFLQHFKYTMPRIDLRKFITFKVVKPINLIGAMKTFKKSNCNLCMQ